MISIRNEGSQNRKQQRQRVYCTGCIYYNPGILMIQKHCCFCKSLAELFLQKNQNPCLDFYNAYHFEHTCSNNKEYYLCLFFTRFKVISSLKLFELTKQLHVLCELKQARDMGFHFFDLEFVFQMFTKPHLGTRTQDRKSYDHCKLPINTHEDLCPFLNKKVFRKDSPPRDSNSCSCETWSRIRIRCFIVVCSDRTKDLFRGWIINAPSGRRVVLLIDFGLPSFRSRNQRIRPCQKSKRQRFRMKMNKTEHANQTIYSNQFLQANRTMIIPPGRQSAGLAVPGTASPAHCRPGGITSGAVCLCLHCSWRQKTKYKMSEAFVYAAYTILYFYLSSAFINLNALFTL